MIPRDNRTKLTGENLTRTGEIFTSSTVVDNILSRLPNEVFTNPRKTFLDPAVGDGQFPVQIITRKIKNGSTPYQALRATFGIDIMPDNVILCRVRLFEAALGMRFSIPTGNVRNVTKREHLIRYVLCRLLGITHERLLRNEYDYTKEEVNQNVLMITKERYPLFKEFREFAMSTLGQTYNTARAEYYIIRNPHNRATGKNLNFLNQLHLVRRVCYNIVCADSLNEWDFENWCFKKTPQSVANKLLEL